MDYRRQVRELASLVEKSKKVMALTGAGVSTESGLPDYRSPGTGLWEKMDPRQGDTLEVLQRDPVRFYDESRERWTVYRNVTPGPAHMALAHLEERGFLAGVVTQNMDSLHKAAGSKKVWEIHGHIRTCRCMRCGSEYDFEELADQLEKGSGLPLCRACRGVLRPNVVLRGEELGKEFLEAEREISNCDLLLTAGTGLAVYPAARLPGLARSFVIINKTPTPWDARAELVINHPAGTVFDDLLKELE